MKLFSNARAKRNTAFMVLLAWLFVLASGVANACLLEARETHSYIATASEAVYAPAILPAHASAVAERDDGLHTAKAPCLKVCDDSSRSLPKQALTVAQPDPGPAPFVHVLWNAVSPVVATHREDMQPAILGLPIRVRYSRLAL